MHILYVYCQLGLLRVVGGEETAENAVGRILKSEIILRERLSLYNLRAAISLAHTHTGGRKIVIFQHVAHGG